MAGRELYRTLFGPGSRGLGAGFLPVVPQNLGDDVVDPLAVDEPVGPVTTHLPVAGGGLCAGARFVAVKIARLQLPQGELSEGVPRAKLHHLTAEALTPNRLVAEGGPGGAEPAHPVDLVNGSRAHRAALELDDPNHVVLTLGHSLQPLVLHLDGRRKAQGHETRDLEVLEPGDHERRVLRPGRPEPYELALYDRAVHARKG